MLLPLLMNLGMLGRTSTPTVYPGSIQTSWQEHVSERYRKRHSRLVSEERQLEQKQQKLEKSLRKAKKKSLPVDGILANYQKIALKLDEKRNEIRLLEIEFNPAVFMDDDDEDDELLFLNA